VSFTDTGLERDYLYARALNLMLPGRTEGALDLGKEVELTHLRLEMTFEGSAALERGEGDLQTIFDGHGGMYEPTAEHLSQIIALVNERFGTSLTQTDQLLFDQFERDWVADPDLAAQAKQNDLGNFRLAFDREFIKTVVARMDTNNEIFKKILDDSEVRDFLSDIYVRKVYGRLREAAPQSEVVL
jgi:type I restriction enzyme R subunit